MDSFKPMSKRFMVWDKDKRKFITITDDDGYEHEIVDISALDLMLGEYGYNYDDVIILQSTNLFDKDGKEIFEGSIVEGEWGNHTGSAYLDFSVYGVVKNLNGVWCIVEDNSNTDGKMLCELRSEELHLCGHILSNPELLEGSDV